MNEPRNIFGTIHQHRPTYHRRVNLPSVGGRLVGSGLTARHRIERRLARFLSQSRLQRTVIGSRTPTPHPSTISRRRHAYFGATPLAEVVRPFADPHLSACSGWDQAASESALDAKSPAATIRADWQERGIETRYIGPLWASNFRRNNLGQRSCSMVLRNFNESEI